MLKKAAALMLSLIFCASSTVQINNVTASYTDQADIAIEIETEDTVDNQTAKLTTSQPVEFSDVLGFSGYYIDETWDDIWINRTYYSNLPDGSSEIIAKSYGFEVHNYQVDIDGDGIKELLCNCTSGGDSHSELYVFKRSDDKINIGYVNWLKLDMTGLFYWGCNAVSTKYDSASGDILITYCIHTNSNAPISLYSDYKIIEYQDWNGDDFPFINIEKAYELYGNRN